MKIPLKKRYLLLIGCLSLAFVAYFTYYFSLRAKKEIVHRKTRVSSKYQHQVVAVPPDGRSIFLATLSVAVEQDLAKEETKKMLEKSVNSNLRRTKYINILTTPARWIETAIWNIVD
ncbi:MAG: hypothetical protein KJ619_06165 [Candidatus Omnitrophica bacterium]|nr:hypothetical protein [Candidatus Omnitrophota bacterium]MBU2251562.1 hypothetical protein [Candidatus Omnitrophota bacterium]MBU2473978.1 hypothetical protein [Candidatus Omnitrophota bacterium]